MSEEQEAGDPTGRRRLLIKAAVGAGVAVAAHSAPRVSAVPAYALTVSSGTSDGKCYGFGWSSNNPTGKGWMKLSDQKKLFSNGTTGAQGPSGGGASQTGNLANTYTWSLPAFPPKIPAASTLTVHVFGCVNEGGGSFYFSGIPSGYRVVLYNGGQAYTKANFDKGNSISSCGGGGVLHASIGKASPIDNGTGLPTGSLNLANNQFCDIATLGATGCNNDDDYGKIAWTFDIFPN